MRRFLALISLMGAVVFGQVPVGTEIINIAQSSYQDANGASFVDQSNTIITTVNEGYQLAIAKTAGATVVAPGERLTYTITVSNTGNISPPAFTISDTVATGLVIISGTPTAIINDQVVIWNVASIAPGQTMTFGLEVEAASDLPAYEVIRNIAWLAVQDGSSLSSEPVDVTVGTLSDLKITKDVAAGNTAVGDTLHYTIKVYNTGNVVSTGNIVTDVLPEHVTFANASNGGSLEAGVVTWELTDLMEGDSLTLSLNVIVDESMPPNTTLTNSASVVNLQGVSKEASVSTVVNHWIQTITKWAEDREYAFGDTVEFVITIDNTSPDPVHAVTVRDTLPAPLQYVSASNSGTSDNGIVVWSLGTLNAGNVRTLTLVTTVGSLLEARPEITNRVWISTANAGRSYGDHVVSLAAFPELTLEKLAPASVLAGDSLYYSFAMSNAGNSMAHDVVLKDTLSPFLSFGSATRDFIYDEASHSILWSVGELASQAVDTLELVTYVGYPIVDGTLLENTAYLSCAEGSATLSTVTTAAISSPALRLKIYGRKTLMAGDSITYRIEYTNIGTEIATEVVLHDTLPNGINYISAELAHTFDLTTRVISWSLADLAPGDSGQVQVAAYVDASVNFMTQLVNGAILTCSQGVQAKAKHELNVRAPALNIDLVGDTTYVLAGDYIQYNLNFANVGDTTATNVVVVDSLPPEVSFLSASNGGIYDPESHSIMWMVGDLEPVGGDQLASGQIHPNRAAKVVDGTHVEGDVQNFIVDVSINYPLPNGMELFNTAYIYSDMSLQAQATWLAIVIASPEFVFTKTADIEVFPGDTIHYQLDYANMGTDHATGVSILDTLDSRVEFLDATSGYVYDAASHSLLWDIGDLRVGDEGSITVTTIVDGMLEDGAQVGNRAWLACNETAAQSAEAITTNILPMSVVLDAMPRNIFGNGVATAQLAAHVYSYLGNPVPDGIDVNFYTDAGVIPDSAFTTGTLNGVAFSTLVSDTVLFEAITATPYARAVYSDTDFAEDTTQVVFLIGAFDGIIYDYHGIPQENIRVQLRSITTGEYAGVDLTDENGYYLIPIIRDDIYQIIYTIIGDDGVPYTTIQEIAIATPTEGSLVTNLNSVSGFIYDEITGLPIEEDSILVIAEGGPDSTETLGKLADHCFCDSTLTDSTGKFFFTNLQPGPYTLRVVYRGISSYSDGGLEVNLNTPGLYIVNANVTLRSSPYYMYKLVDKLEAAVGDTLHYILHTGTQEGISFNDSTFITDYLPAGLVLIENSIATDVATVYTGIDAITNEMRFTRTDVQAGDSIKIEFDARITIDAGLGWIENRALVASNIDSTWSDRNPLSHAKTKIIFPFLKVTKQSNRRVIEVGDVITYTVKLTNTSTDDFVHDFIVEDVLPYGFKYRKNSTYWDGSKLADPDMQEAVGKRIAMAWTINDTLLPGETFEMKYRIIAGLNSKEGVNTNEVIARGHTLLGFPVLSNLATADVILKPGLFSDRGLIIGKVFYDVNGNKLHDNGEETVKNVELIMENGARILTDEFGKYSVPDVEAGVHVIRINERTLPALSEVIHDSPDYLGDTRSKLVRIPAASIAKVNFALREIATPGIITGTVYYDMNGNGVRDADEDVQANAMVLLDSTNRVMTDSLGRYIFKKTPLGDLRLRLDESSLPSYAALVEADSSLAPNAVTNLWTVTLFSGDSVNMDIPLKKHELFSVLSKESTLEMKTAMLTEEFRLLVYKPWSMLIRVGFVSGSATLQSEIFTELKNIGDLMKWQTQINLDINGHTDNVPLNGGGAFADNQALSEARAQAIRNYLIQTMGISPNRIRAFGHGDTLPMADNNTAEGRALNRRVEMVFFNAVQEENDFSQLEFLYDIKYSGEVSVSNIRFHQELPPGFIYKEGTAVLDNKNTEPISHAQESDVWAFGDWNARQLSKFDVAMTPADFDKVQGTGEVSAYLEMTDEDGNQIVTDSLKTRISTLVEELSFYMVLEGTQFDVGSADLKPSAYPSLQKMGKFLAWQPSITIVIEGFTDNRGSLEFNMLLSDWRATSVKDYLVENFDVNPDNISTHGLGPHYPAGDNETWAGRALNRRVEVLVNAEVGEAALLELDVIKESLKRKISIPVDPMQSMTPDSALSIPANQPSTILLNLSFPAYATADSMALSLALPNDLEYVDLAGTYKTWGIGIPKGSLEVTPPVVINAPEGVVGVRDLYLGIMLYKDGMPISSDIEKVLHVNIEEPETANE